MLGLCYSFVNTYSVLPDAESAQDGSIIQAGTAATVGAQAPSEVHESLKEACDQFAFGDSLLE
jgi:hypothetical protein